MVVISTLRSLIRLPISIVKNDAPKRFMSEHRTFVIKSSDWQWTKFKDYINFYVLLGVIPCSLAIFYANVFIGPSTLAEIPPDYTPKHWEYYRSPVTRFIAKYIMTNPQQDYEKFLAYMYQESEIKRIRLLESEIKKRMSEKLDYQAYYYRPVLAKYHRVSREAADYLESIRGE
ncbi:unnamed protein product [Phyllotreta striolata]|uniref:NADH dehydrogenase [ubiquinone] 1 beta subcomplex subunit 5, mitochondrial n=1 Tax=Phyllotreta striolata TaxID=444603 RepID=A0A9N9XNW8_PHYSR|nr:unnamed protein product [Phyllotreta striolata]